MFQWEKWWENMGENRENMGKMVNILAKWWNIWNNYLELPKPLKRSVHFESTGFYVLFIKTTVPLQKNRLFSNKPSFCVYLPCEACEVIYFDLLSLQTQPLTMKWSENQRSRLTSNQPMPANINKRAGSGLRFA
jgi:hypothetical protein